MMQAMATGMTSLSDIYTDHSTRTLTPMVEQISEWTDHSLQKSAYVMSIHQDATKLGRSIADGVASSAGGGAGGAGGNSTSHHSQHRTALHAMARLQTLYNTTHAEMDHWFHEERCLEWSDIAYTWIEGELATLEECITLLHGCRAAIRNAIRSLPDHDEVTVTR